VKAYQKRGLPMATGHGDASEFDAAYYRKLLEKPWEEVALILQDAH
jgi:hypothetical protein